MSHADLPHDSSTDREFSSRNDGPRIAIIGAGMAGISCAQALTQAGLHATVFEKSRGPGGRLATRRNDAGDHFDHGAQYITTRAPAFSRWLESLKHTGSVAAWEPQLDAFASASHHPWMVGTPAMNALLKPLASALDVRNGVSITALQRDGHGWRLLTDDGSLPASFDVVISTVPCPQAHALLAVDPTLQAQLGSVAMAPCWALMMTFDSALAVDYDARRFDAGATAWVARQASRPGRAADNNAWVMHAAAGWSADHLELDTDEAAALLLQDFARAIGHALPKVTFLQAHRWRYALTTQALDRAYAANADETLFAAGDWCLGARVECAHESGVTVARVLANRHRPPVGRHVVGG